MRRIWMGLCALLLGCDDGTIITHVDKLVAIGMSDLIAMQRGGGIRTEIHGTPFEGASPQELATALRPPARASQAIKWRAVPVGSVQHGYRMILHFNPRGAPNAFRDCKLTEPQQTAPPQETGFTVNMTFCKGDTWEAHGFLQSRKTEAGDFEDYTRVMKALMNNIFTEAGNDR